MKVRNILPFVLVILFSLCSLPADMSNAGACFNTVSAQGGKKEKKAVTKPSKRAKLSARDARNSKKIKQKQIMGRAKVRMFFHNTFNRKPGKTKNFYKQERRNRKPYK